MSRHYHALADRDSLADLDFLVAAVSQRDLSPLRLLSVDDEDVILAVLFQKCALWNQEGFQSSVGLDIDPDEGSRLEGLV